MICEAQLDDSEAIVRVHRMAFERGAEGDLVDRLRADGSIVASIVAKANGEIIGSAVFSKLSIRSGDDRLVVAVALAPVAVVPAFQRRGFGGEMIAAGLELCSERGYQAAFVLGDPRYYRRFGFSTALTSGFESVYKGPHWMAMELAPGALHGLSGIVEYPRAFAAVD